MPSWPLMPTPMWAILIMLTSLAPSPMASVTARLWRFTRSTTSAFWRGVTRQQMTALQRLATSRKSSSKSSSKACARLWPLTMRANPPKPSPPVISQPASSGPPSLKRTTAQSPAPRPCATMPAMLSRKVLSCLNTSSRSVPSTMKMSTMSSVSSWHE
uniref:Putative secreted protein n=1 Tax=Ixodes ricinus TaxID=34613 RepID=A0A6B0UXZ6_IXORI